ncbi:MAG: glycosyltransferase, partial [Eubacteriales bacterium]
KNVRKIKISINNLLDKHKDRIAGIISYGTPNFAIELMYIKKWCTAHNIKFYANCVDLSSVDHGNFVSRIMKKIDINIRYYLNKKHSDGIIAVSKYIEEYFIRGNKRLKTVVIPPLRDTETFNMASKDELPAIKRFIYAGMPFPVDGRKVDTSGYKDRLDIAIELMYTLWKSGKVFTFDLYGLNKDQYLGVIPHHKNMLEEMSQVISFHGRVSTITIKEEVTRSHFTILLREKNRMTMAGFSSKLVESISCGTPLVTTNTSDLKDYIVEGVNGWYLDLANKEACVNTLEKLVDFDSDKIWNIKKQCFESKLYDYRKYSNKMKTFLDQQKV